MATFHRIVAFGSSSVYGRGDPDGGGFVGRLRRWHEPRNDANLVYNLGVGGDTTGGMLERLESEVRFRRPDLILLYPGLNDARRKGSRDALLSTPPELFQKNVRTLLEVCTGIAKTAFISSFPIDELRTSPWRDTEFFYLAEDAKAFTAAGREICSELEVPYLGIYERWSELPNSSELSVDGLHGRPIAHQHLFEELRDFLVGVFGENQF